MTELVERVDDQDRVLGVVRRDEAIRRGWLHRIATTVCRDEQGRFLVHRRGDALVRFPGYHEVTIGGAVAVGESYQQAAARELFEELGIRAVVRPVVTFLCRGELGSYWLGVHDAAVTGTPAPDRSVVAWTGWMTHPELQAAVKNRRFIPDGQEAFRRYLAASGSEFGG
ncbi:NUDIX hydrolase [Actinoplanes sp. TFC3]|uniref:NUDIX hydrolase n=1 Tax=Actinoplanes sp. TFC3 TaxID=1710355 RepID=UPI00082B3402|nr:NUDIX domain-containing protein [Actinoplanes sp. TFC3]